MNRFFSALGLILVAIELWVISSQSSDLESLRTRRQISQISLAQPVRSNGSHNVVNRSDAPDFGHEAMKQGERDALAKMKISTREQVMEMRKSTAEYQRESILRKQISVDVRFGRFLKKLELNLEESSRLKQLLLDRENLSDDVNGTIEGLALSAKDLSDITKALVASSKQDIESGIAMLLGPDRYAMYNEYVASMDKQLFVTALSQTLVPLGEQLSSDQETKLLALLEASQTANGRNGVALIPVGPEEDANIQVGNFRFVTVGSSAYINSLGMVISNYPIEDLLLNSSSQFLSPRQLECLRKQQQIQSAQSKMATLFHFNK